LLNMFLKGFNRVFVYEYYLSII
jgi:hypothetical protein